MRPDIPFHPARTAPADRRRAQSPSEIDVVNAVELAEREFPEPRWVVKNLITEGLTILGGKPKIGKSWLALGIANAVATGGQALGVLSVDQGDVLVLALEDTQRRLQRRLRAVLQGATPCSRLHFATEWRRLDDGGLDDLRRWLDQHPDTRLVVIDTLAMVRGKAVKDAGVYADDYQAVSGVKALADERVLAILVVHHLRKATADDPLDTVSGSTGLTGAVDAVLVIQRERARADAILHVIGRDIEEAEKALSFDGQTGTWTLVGEAEEFRRSEQQAAIIRAILDAGDSLSPKDLEEVLGKKRGAIKMLLHRMAKEGTLIADGTGKYKVPYTDL